MFRRDPVEAARYARDPALGDFEISGRPPRDLGPHFPGRVVIALARGGRDDRAEPGKQVVLLRADAGGDRDDEIGLQRRDALEADLAAQHLRRRIAKRRLRPGPDAIGVAAIPVAYRHRHDAEGQQVVVAREVERHNPLGPLRHDRLAEPVAEDLRKVRGQPRPRCREKRGEEKPRHDAPARSHGLPRAPLRSCGAAPARSGGPRPDSTSRPSGSS